MAIPPDPADPEGRTREGQVDADTTDVPEWARTRLTPVNAHQATWLRSLAEEPRCQKEVHALDGPVARSAMRDVAAAYDAAAEPPLDWESRALNAEDLLIRVLLYARPASEGGFTVPAFVVHESEALVPDWRQRRSRVLERAEQAEARRDQLAAEGLLEDDGADIFAGTATGFGTRAQQQAWARARDDAERWVERPILTREQVEAIGDSETSLVRLTRLWEPEPKVIFEGEVLIRRDRDLLLVIAPGVGSWAEYSTKHDFSGDHLIAEDYMLEFLAETP